MLKASEMDVTIIHGSTTNHLRRTSESQGFLWLAKTSEVKNRSRCAEIMATFAISFKLELRPIRWTPPGICARLQTVSEKNVICFRGLVTEERKVRGFESVVGYCT